jgi:dTDP-glucose 4,6-dehydratase
MKRVVYVTGCLGFMGSYVTKRLLDLDWYVRGVDKMTYAANSKSLNEFYKYSKFVFEKKDINDIEFLYDCDYVINMAAETHVDNSIVNSEDFIHSNINGVHHLLELIRKGRNLNTPTLLHFSTDEVYGDIQTGKHSEKDLLRPSNPYAATKSAGDMLILAWARTYNVPYVIVRPTNNYGIGQYTEKLIPKVCKSLLLNRKVPLHEQGRPIRTWLHAKDTADAVLTIINANVKNEIYNISSHFEQENIKTVQSILDCYFNGNIPGSLEDYVQLNYARAGQDVRYAIDDSKIRMLGWQPKCDFNTEIKTIVDYYRENFIW